MSNGEVCCIVGICCPPARAKARLAVELAKDCGCDSTTAGKVADYVFERFALAPKSLQPFLDDVVLMAKHGQEQDQQEEGGS